MGGHYLEHIESTLGALSTRRRMRDGHLIPDVLRPKFIISTRRDDMNVLNLT
jgi:hypothetical protein